MGVTTITIEWNEVECADRNGDISSYSVRYGPSSTPLSNKSVENNTDPNSRTFSVGRREIGTSYSFEVAAVNRHGIGLYNTTIMVTIPVPSGKYLIAIYRYILKLLYLILGLGFYLNGQMYPNNSIVTITDIEVGDNALFCLSNSSSCCRSRDGMARGQWFLPGGSSSISGNGESFSMANFSRSRRPSAVLLNRRNNAIGPEGLYRCDVIDARNITQTLYIGINQSK